ncbi:MAG: sulfatase family protein, partial [Gammaproteobacteria bacterium]
SPSRASILTGQYAFRHGAVDNSHPMLEGIQTYPEALQAAGFATGFFGKWHIGAATDDPQPGFDRWVSFQGQGVYYDPVLNFDGERRVRVEGYTTDLLTDYAIEWLEGLRDSDQPFMLYLSHKAVHSEFTPADRHRGIYSDAELVMPDSMADTESNYAGKPRWVREQRFSWHGVDYMYHSDMQPEDLISAYAETLMAVDDSVARVVTFLEDNGLADETLVIYMGDNGFMLGEHGLIDKRQAYEESMRVPMVAWSPGFIEPGTVIEENVLNIDLAPTFLEIAGTDMPNGQPVDGRSILGLLEDGGARDWRDSFVYQYFWERAFPQTPTTYAIRSERFKYIFYHGVWDRNELYDLESDPKEMHNLIDIPGYANELQSLHSELFEFLERNDALSVGFRAPSLNGFIQDERRNHP